MKLKPLEWTTNYGPWKTNFAYAPGCRFEIGNWGDGLQLARKIDDFTAIESINSLEQGKAKAHQYATEHILPFIE